MTWTLKNDLIHTSVIMEIIYKMHISLRDAALFARRGDAALFCMIKSNNAPVALCPPSVSQYSGTMAEE